MRHVAKIAGVALVLVGLALCALVIIPIAGISADHFLHGRKSWESPGDLSAIVMMFVSFALAGAAALHYGVKLARAKPADARASGSAIAVVAAVLGSLAALLWTFNHFGVPLKTAKALIAAALGALWAVVALGNASIAWRGLMKKGERVPSMVMGIGPI